MTHPRPARPEGAAPGVYPRLAPRAASHTVHRFGTAPHGPPRNVARRADPALRIGFLSAGGWDTHVNQGAATGLLAMRFANLARALVQLHADFDRPGDLVLVMSEFGRTSGENGARGTDHGRGNAMWLIGRQVAGGRVHGRWEGLAPGSLNEGRDLPVLHDFRAVIAQPLARVFRLPERRLADLFPGATWDRSLDGLVRRA